MHLKQQHISGKANGPECIALSSVQGRRYMVYGSDKFVIVYTDEFAHVQTFDGATQAPVAGADNTQEAHELTSVSMCPGSGYIAAASAAGVSVWKPAAQTNPDDPPRWELGCTIGVQFPVKSMDWSKSGVLFLGGSTFALVEVVANGGNLQPRVLFASSVPSEITRGRFSPDGTIVATYAKHDRLVKLWFQRTLPVNGALTTTYDFTYLPHSRGIVYAEWRRSRSDIKYAEENVLLTMSQDNICRLWCQASAETPSKFFMCCLIDVSQTPASLSVSAPEMVAIHWMDQQEVFAAVSMRVEMEERGLKAIRKARRVSAEDTWKVKKLKDTLKENPDMLIQIQQDGTVVLWGIQHLLSQPRRMPKVIVLMKIKNALTPGDYEFFRDTPHIFQNENVIKSSGVFLPSELYFLTSNESGVVNVYLKNLDEFFAISRDSSHIRLVRSFAGHRMSPIKFVRHPVLDICASVGKDGELNIWRVTVPEVGVRFSEGLDFVAAMPHKGGPRRLAWLPQAPILLIQSSTGLGAYEIVNNSVKKIWDFDNYNGDRAFTMLQVYEEPEQNGSNKTVGYVIAICEDATVLMWTAEVEGKTLTKVTFIDEDRLDFPEDTTLKYASPTNAIVSVYSPTAPLGSHLFLTYTDDNIVRFWHTRNGTLASLTAPGGGMRFRVSADMAVDPSLTFGSVKRVKASPFGKLAIVHTRLSQDVITILDYKATGTRAREEDEIKFHHPIIDLDWNLTSDAQMLLAIAVGNDIVIYCPHRVDAIGLYFNMFNAPVWRQISRIRLPPELGSVNGPIGRCLAWMNNGLLVFATDREISCYSKWLRDAGTVSGPGQTGVTRELTVFQKASRVNGRLPDHHPMLLIQYLLWGKYDYVKYVLSFVLRFARLMSDSDREMRDIPVPMWKLFGDDSQAAEAAKKEAFYDQLFGSDDRGEESHVEGEFGVAEAQALLELLTRVPLPNIDSSEQLILSAVVDTVMQSEQQRRSLDENGIRYLLYLRISIYLTKLTPAAGQAQMKPVDIFWAFHSESQDILLDTCVSLAGGKLMWPQARAFGLGYWMKSVETLKRTFEIMGRNHFKAVEEGDPVGCALFFTALKKKNLLLALWKTTPDTSEKATMLKFLSNDFNDPRWQTAAAKNAFALMARQRFEYAVAFFLLGNRLRDAVSVCLKQLDDIQLAFTITRIYDGEQSDLLKEIVMSHMLPRTMADQDRWMASLAFSAMGEREKAILALMLPLDVLSEDKPMVPVTKALLAALNDPALLVGYDYLKRLYAKLRFFPQVPQDVETEFIFQTISAYEKIGCPGLALKILEQFNDWLPRPDPATIEDDEEPLPDAAFNSIIKRRGSFALTSGASDWGTITTVQKAADMFLRAGSHDANSGNGIPTEERRKSQVSLDYAAKAEPQRSETGTLLQVPTASDVKSTERAEDFDWSQPISSGSKASERAEDFDWSQPITGSSKVPDTYVSALELELPDAAGGDGPSMTFADADDGASSGYPASKVSKMDRKTAFHFLMENKNARLLKWFLGMRMTQAATNSTANVCDNLDILKEDAVFSNFFNRMNEGLLRMAKDIDMSLEALDHALALRCRESDMFRPYIELLPLYGHLTSYADDLSDFMVQECNTVARLSFEVARQALPQVFIGFIASFSRRLLASLNRWQEKSLASGQATTSSSFIPQAAATAFVSLMLVSNMTKDFEMVAQLVQGCGPFFASLRTRDLTSLYTLIDQLLTGKLAQPASNTTVAEVPVEDDPNMEFDEAMGEFHLKPKSQDNLTAEDLEMYMAISYTSSKIGEYLLVLEDSGSDLLYSFVRDALLRPLSTLLFRLQTTLLTSPLFAATPGGPSLASVVQLLRGPQPERLWKALASVADPSLMYDVLVARLPLIQSPINKERDTEVVFRNPDVVGTFAINPLDENIVAVGTAKGIFELDVEASIFYYKSADGLDESGSPQSPARKAASPDVNALSRSKSVVSKLPLDFDNGMRLRRSIVGVSCVEPHPTLNYYLAAVSEQANEKNPPYISLYQFGQPDPLIHYNARGLSRISRLRFDPLGHVFGASDSSGNLTLWRFESQEKAALPFASYACHSNSVNDFCFLGSTTLIATAGQSANNANVCIWDTLLPTSRALIKAFNVHEGGAFSLAYAARHQLLFSGGKKGDICIYDVRQRALLNTLQAHSLLVKTLTIDENQDIFISGSSDGDIKAWSLKGFGRKDTWSNVHHSNKVLRLPTQGRNAVATQGVMEVVASGNYIYTCGGDGSVRRSRIAEL